MFFLDVKMVIFSMELYGFYNIYMGEFHGDSWMIEGWYSLMVNKVVMNDD